MFRRGGYVLCWALVFNAAWWVAGYADRALAAGVTGMETAGVIAAVLTPLSGLAALVFTAYSNGRVNDKPQDSSR